MNIVQRILEYLFYKIQVLTRHMDTSMYLNIHVPFIMSTILLFYLADIAIIYYYIIMGYSPQKNPSNVFLVVLIIMILLWSSLYFYYRYKHRNERIMERKIYEHSSNVWAYLFIFTPFIPYDLTRTFILSPLTVIVFQLREVEASMLNFMLISPFV